jgi:uroporphyrinogen-III decarboxylase
MPVENTSTMMISPELYRRYCVPQLRDYADIFHRHGKKMILHMCGHLKNLLVYAKETRLDGINSLTPPPIGDSPYELALDIFGEDFILLGAGINGAIFQGPYSTADDIKRELDRIYTPRIRKANMVLSLPADGLPTDLWRFLAVREWMEKYGKN